MVQTNRTKNLPVPEATVKHTQIQLLQRIEPWVRIMLHVRIMEHYETLRKQEVHTTPKLVNPSTGASRKILYKVSPSPMKGLFSSFPVGWYQWTCVLSSSQKKKKKHGEFYTSHQQLAAVAKQFICMQVVGPSMNFLFPCIYVTFWNRRYLDFMLWN